MYFSCICGEEGDLHVLFFRHFEAPPHTLFIWANPGLASLSGGLATRGDRNRPRH